jgi:hypothetical protein
MGKDMTNMRFLLYGILLAYKNNQLTMDLRNLQKILLRKEELKAPPKQRNGYPVINERPKKKPYKFPKKPSNGVGVGY